MNEKLKATEGSYSKYIDRETKKVCTFSRLALRESEKGKEKRNLLPIPCLQKQRILQSEILISTPKMSFTTSYVTNAMAMDGTT